MKKLFWAKIAYKNIIENKKYYFANVFVNMFTIMVFYLFVYVTNNSNISQVAGYKSLQLMLFLGCIFTGLFTLTFKFYSNSFFIKRRKKEIGLYSVWGLEKRNTNSILLYETIYIYILSMVLGIGLGIAFQNSIYSYLFRLMKCDDLYASKFTMNNIWITGCVFLALDLVLYLYNTINIGAKQTITLLKEEQTGEQRVKFEKIDFLNGMIGLLMIIAVYIYINTNIKIVDSISIIFFALIVAFIGSYLFLSSFITIVILGLKKRQKIYYNKIFYSTIAKLAYRMKQNALGLTAICILLTCIICGLSTTISLYYGTEKQVEDSLYLDGLLIINNKNEVNLCKNKINEAASELNLKVEKLMKYSLFSKGAFYDKKENAFALAANNNNFVLMNLVTIDDFNTLEKTNLTLDNDEVYIVSQGAVSKKSQVSVFGHAFHVKSYLASFILIDEQKTSVYNDYYIILKNDKEINTIRNTISAQGNRVSGISHYFEYLISGNKTDHADYNSLLKKKIGAFKSISTYSNKADIRKQLFAENSIYLFIGFFMSIILVIYMIFIMYHKQIQEAIDDIGNIQIIRKIGMDDAQIKKMILCENGLLFLFPVILSLAHTIAFFNVICKALNLFTLSDESLIRNCIIGIFILTLIVYCLMYFGSFIVYQKITLKKSE